MLITGDLTNKDVSDDSEIIDSILATWLEEKKPAVAHPSYRMVCKKLLETGSCKITIDLKQKLETGVLTTYVTMVPVADDDVDLFELTFDKKAALSDPDFLASVKTTKTFVDENIVKLKFELAGQEKISKVMQDILTPAGSSTEES